MPAGAQTHRLINSSKPMSFTITTDRATTPRARTLLDIFRHKRNRPNRLPRSPSRASASRNRPVGGGLPMVEQSGHHVDVTAPGVEGARTGPATRGLTQTCLCSLTDICTSTSDALLCAEVVAQTIGVLDFLCVRDKAPILERVYSLADSPLRPPEVVPRGRRQLSLSISYNRFGLCDNLRG